MKSILDPRFKYVNSVSTDIRKTFRRARKEMQRSIYPADVPVSQEEQIEVMNLMRQPMRSN